MGTNNCSLESEFIEEIVEVIWKRTKGKMEAEEGGDALKSMEVLAALDEMKSMEVLALVI